MMINMSLIPAGDIGIDADGHLVFDPVGGMAFEDMLRLRDMFPNTAGNVAIGIDDRQIQLMLASDQIDYVIPYHVSGLNKKMRKYMDIQAWQEYTSSQNEKGNKRGKKGKAPALKEWFNEAEGVKAKDGYEYMRQASEKYLQLCYERNLAPKFPQYLNKNADGSYSLKEEYANYWKLLIDRKMVNQKTGRVIAQKAVLPNFDSDFILGNEAKGITGILDQALNDPAVQDVVTAENMVFEKFSNWSSDINNADAEAIEEAKHVRDLAARVAVQKTVEAGGVKSQPGAMWSLDSTGRELSNAQQETKVSYSLNETTDGRYVAVVDDDILSHINTAHWTKEKRNEAKKAAKKALRNFKDGIIVNGVRRKVNNVTSDEYTGSNYTYMLYKKNKKVYADKMRAASVIDDVIEATVGWKSDDGLGHPRNDNFVDFEHGSTLIMSGDAKYSADVSVGITDQGERVVYDMTDIVPAEFELKEKNPPSTYVHKALGTVHEDSSNGSIAENKQNVKENFSLNDNTGNRNYQAELYELQRKRTAMLEADEAYRKAEEQRKQATTFSERVQASRALKEAKARIDTIEIDQRISELRELITAAEDEKNQRHRREQEQYADAKTAGYAAEPDTRLKSLDSAYEKAVNDGNMVEAERLVNQAAEAAMPKSVVRDKSGKLLRVYHYTNNDFTVFDRSRARTGDEMDGFFFAVDPDSTKEYGDRQVSAYLNITHLAVNPVLDRGFDDSGELLRKKLASQGYDGVARTENGEIYEYMVFDPEQIKSADPVVYDDAGNVIPLSERFNKQKNDIRFSLNDSTGRELSEGQREYFKASAVRDEQGRLKLMYHGTSSGGFTIFDTFGGNHGLFGIGSYFTDSKTVAEGYTKKGKGKNQQIYPCYLNITNPIDMDAVGNRAQWQEAFPDATLPETGTNEEFYRAVEDYFVDEMYPKWEAADAIRGGLEGMGYDGITHIGGGRTRMDSEQHRVYIAFFEEQIKSVDNLKPTTDADIRFSLSKPVEAGGMKTNFSVNTVLLSAYREPITMQDVEVLRSIGRKSINSFTSADLQKAGKWAYKFYQELGVKSPFFRAWFGNWRAQDTITNVNIADASTSKNKTSGKTTNFDTGMTISWSTDLRGETRIHSKKDSVSVLAVNDIEQIIQKAIYLETIVSQPDSKSKLAGTAFMHSFYSLYRNKEGITLIKMYVEQAISNKGDDVFERAYQLKDIKKIATVSGGVLPEDGSLTGETVTSYTISDLYAFVKQYDKDFTAGKGVSPLLLNEDGTPKKVFHGTLDARLMNEEGHYVPGTVFTVFDNSKSFYSDSEHRTEAFFFASNKKVAEAYAPALEENDVNKWREPHIYDAFLKIENPLIVEGKGAKWNEVPVPDSIPKKRYFNYRTNSYEFSDTAKTDYIAKQAKKLGYDGVIFKDIVDYNAEDPSMLGDVYAVFDSTQIKSATDNIGLFDSQNPDIRYSVDHDLLRETVEAIDKTALEENLGKLIGAENLKGLDLWLLEPSRIFDAVAGGNKELRNALHQIFEKPHSDATGRFAENQLRMVARVEQIAVDAGALTIDKKGRKTFHEDVSAAIQNYGEGYQMNECEVEAWAVSQYEVHVVAKNKKTGDIHMDKDLTLKELRRNFGYENGTRIWEKAFSKKTENYRTVTNSMGLPGDTNIKKEGVKVEAYIEGDGLQVIATKENGEQVFSGKMNLAELRKAFGVKAADEIWKAAAENESPLTPDIVYDFHDGREVVAHVAGRTPHGMRGLKFTACKWRGAGKDNSM